MRWVGLAVLVGLVAVAIVWLSLPQAIDTPACRGPEHTSPDGRCYAYYTSTNYAEGDVTTQAMFICRAKNGSQGGGNLHSSPPGSKGGIGVEWLDDKTLRLHVPADQVELDHKISHPPRVQFFERKIDIVRVPITVDHPDYLGCWK